MPKTRRRLHEIACRTLFAARSRAGAVFDDAPVTSLKAEVTERTSTMLLNNE